MSREAPLLAPRLPISTHNLKNLENSNFLHSEMIHPLVLPHFSPHNISQMTHRLAHDNPILMTHRAREHLSLGSLPPFLLDFYSPRNRILTSFHFRQIVHIVGT